MGTTVKCPVCSKVFGAKPSKAWKFRFCRVNRFECEECKAKFNVYEGPKPKFIIPRAKR